jgi:hypothetical protein
VAKRKRGCPPHLRAQRDWEDLPADLRKLVLQIRDIVSKLPEAAGFKVTGRRKYEWGGGEVIFFLPVGGQSNLGKAFAMDYYHYVMRAGDVDLIGFTVLGIRHAKRAPELARFPRWRSW